MEAPHVYVYVVHYKGNDVECYGILEEDSNFSVICENEEYDDVWTEGNLTTGEPFTSWEEVVEHLQPQFFEDIVEIGAC